MTIKATDGLGHVVPLNSYGLVLCYQACKDLVEQCEAGKRILDENVISAKLYVRMSRAVQDAEATEDEL